MNYFITAFLISLLTWIGISLIISMIFSYFYDDVELSFIWFDFWIGMYYDREKRILYNNPFPTLVFIIDLNKRKEKDVND